MSDTLTVRARSETRSDVRFHRGVATSLFLLAAVLAANALLGPLVGDVIEYRFSDSLVNQGVGLDFVALVAAVPLAVAAGVLVWRGSHSGLVLAFIPSTFAAYMAPQYVVGPDYVGLPGNNERFILLHVGLLVLGVGVTLAAWNAIDPARLRPATEESDRRRSIVLFGVAAFVLVGRWLPALADLMSGSPSNPEFLENPTSYLLIGILDLGLVVPASIAAAIALLRRVAWARKAAAAVIGWFALVPASIAAMALVMWMRDDPNLETSTLAIFVVAGVVFTAGAAFLYRPMLRRAEFGDLPERVDAGS